MKGNSMYKYPVNTTCICGEIAYLKYKKVANKFDDQTIDVTNVPIYECLDFHNQMARITRVNLDSLIMNAIDNGLTEIEYKDVR